MYDIAILGGGPGGYKSALEAAKQGAKVCLVEKDELGGTCLNYGCIPTKSLIASAVLIDNIKRSSEFGIEIENFSINIKKIMQRKNKIVAGLRAGLNIMLAKNKINVIQGTGVLTNPNQLSISETAETIAFKNLIIATGTQPFVPKKFQSSNELLTYKQILDLEEIPQRLLIIGGGAIGCEFATIYSILGSQVTLLEKQATILPETDTAVSTELQKTLKKRKIKLHTNTELTALNNSNNKITAQFSGQEIAVDKILFAIGNRGNNNFLKNKNINLELDSQGFVKINENLQTNIPHIYAIGDITGKSMFAHTAFYQAGVAINNILTKNKRRCTYQHIPSVVFTLPEIASIGLTEKEARKKFTVEVLQSSFFASGRARTLGDTTGFIKIVYEKQTEKILGVHIVGHSASEVIAEAACYVANEMKLTDICKIIHAHPTLNEVLMETAMLK
jgi:dihydrolipoamide dehydrogenase